MSWLVETLIASTLLMAAVLLLRRHVRRAFGAQVAYALWALPALRLVLPPIPESWREAAATPISQAGETITVLILPAGGATATAAAATAPALPVALVVGLAWAGGAALFLGWHALAHRRFCRRLLTGATALDRRDGVSVVASDAATGPLAFGIRHRYVAFPRDFADRYDPLERELALDHELGHHARGDLAANWVALAVLAIHWFNPLAWRAFRAFRADQELANDARVLAGRSRADRHIYACAIVKAAHGGVVSAACHLHTIEDLKGRLRMLTVSKTSRRRLAAGVAAVGVLGTLGLGLTVSGSEAAAAITDKVGAVVEVPAAVPAPLTTPDVPPVAAVPPGPAAPVKRDKKKVVIVRDGKTTVYEGADADTYLAANPSVVPPMPPLPAMRPMPAMPSMPGVPGTSADGKAMAYNFRRMPDGKVWRSVGPTVISTRCPGDAKKPLVEHGRKDGEELITVCTNRIDMVAKDAERQKLASGEIERNARAQARAGLVTARAAITRDRNLSAEQRAEALAGIAQAEAELAGDAD